MFNKMGPCGVFLTNLVIKIPLLILVLITIYESGQQLSKYIAAKATVASSVEKHDTLQYPSISVCPGFRHEEVMKYPWLLVAWNVTELSNVRTSVLAKSTEDIYRIWDNITYKLEDFLISFRDPTGQLYTSQDINSSHIVVVERRDTYCGKCYTFRITKEVQAMQYATIYVDLSKLEIQSLVWYFHHPKASFLLNGAYFWKGPIFAAEAKSNKLTQVDIIKDILTIATSLTNGSAMTEEDYYDCINNWIRMYLQNVLSNSPCGQGAKVCYFPLVAGIFDLANMTDTFPVCLNVTDFLCTLSVLNNMLASYRNPDFPACPQPTSQEIYSGSVMEDSSRVLRMKDWSAVTISFKSTDVNAQEELLMMDWYDLISALGGVVGFFLGWSFRDLDVLVRMGLVTTGIGR